MRFVNWFREGLDEFPSGFRPFILGGAVMVVIAPFVILAAAVWPR